MLQLEERADGKILSVKVTDRLSKSDYQHFLPQVERLINRHGKIRILCQMHDFHGWELGALWEDIKFDFKHFAHIERLALVDHRKWQAGMAAFCKPFTNAKVRHFDESELEQAEEWIWSDLPLTAKTSAPFDVVQEASEESLPASDAPAY